MQPERVSAAAAYLRSSGISLGSKAARTPCEGRAAERDPSKRSRRFFEIPELVAAYSALIPASRMTFPHLLISVRIRVAESWGVLAATGS